MDELSLMQATQQRDWRWSSRSIVEMLLVSVAVAITFYHDRIYNFNEFCRQPRTNGSPLAPAEAGNAFCHCSATRWLSWLHTNPQPGKANAMLGNDWCIGFSCNQWTNLPDTNIRQWKNVTARFQPQLKLCNINTTSTFTTHLDDVRQICIWTWTW